MKFITIMLITHSYYSYYALSSLLTRDSRIGTVSRARDVAETLKILKSSKGKKLPDAILYDIDLLDQASDAIIEELRSLAAGIRTYHPTCYLVCCSDVPRPEIVKAAINEGASIVSKDEMCHQVGQTIVKAMEGWLVLTPKTYELSWGRISIEGVKDLFPYGVYNLPKCKCSQLSDDNLRRFAQLYCIDNLPGKELEKRMGRSKSGINRLRERLFKELNVSNKRQALEVLLGITPEE
jgi:hypothetical protein